MRRRGAPRSRKPSATRYGPGARARSVRRDASRRTTTFKTSSCRARSYRKRCKPLQRRARSLRSQTQAQPREDLSGRHRLRGGPMIASAAPERVVAKSVETVRETLERCDREGLKVLIEGGKTLSGMGPALPRADISLST